MTMRCSILVAVALVGATILPGMAWAEAPKCRNIRLAVPHAVGSATDMVMRAYAETINRRGSGPLIRVVNVTKKSVIKWAVFAPSTDVDYGALSGTYFGASAEAAAGIGLGANVLSGGWQRSVNLQPVSLSAHTGFNAAGGVGAIVLTGAGKY